MRRTLVILVLLTGFVPARHANAQAQPSAPILFNLHAAYTPASEVNGRIQYFRGLDPSSAYRERDMGGVGAGGSIGYRPFAYYEIHLGLDVHPRFAERDGMRVKQTETRMEVELRIGPSALGSRTIPYYGLGISSLYVNEPNQQPRPWPYTSAMWGTGPMVFAGVQRRVGARAALDIGVALTATRVSTIQILGDVDKQPGAGTSLIPRARIGLSWLPPIAEVRRVALDVAPLAVERTVRLHERGDVTHSGTVVAAWADSVLLQTEIGGRPTQLAVPFDCLQGIDILAGNRSPERSIIASAVQGMIAGSTALMVARWAGAGAIPNEPTHFAAAVAVPSAVAGGLLGLVRERRRWVRVRLPAEVSAAPRRDRGACPK